jgi:hypothetical protein
VKRALLTAVALLWSAAGCELVAGLRTRTLTTAPDGGVPAGMVSDGGTPTGGAAGSPTGGAAGSSTGGAPGGSGGVTTGGSGGGTGGAVGGTGGAPDAGTDGGPPQASCPPWGRITACDPKYMGNDAANCCVAGRSCGGGACVAGKCQPSLIASQVMSGVEDIQVAGSYVVVAGGCEKRTRRYAKTGGGEFLLPLDLDGECVARVGVVGDQVYWIEWDGPFLQAAPLDGSAQARHVGKVPVPLTDVTLRQMAIDQQRAYWVTSEPSGVWFAPLGGSGGDARAVAAQQSTGLAVETTTDAFGVAVDGSHVYWTDREQHNVRRRPLATLDQNLPGEQIATGGMPRHLTTDADRVYWVTEDGFIMAHAKTVGGAAAMLAGNQTGAFNIIADDHYVYWTRNIKDGTVSRVPKNGGAVEDLASGQKSPLGLAQECGTVYWTNQNDDGPGEIVRITK